MMPMKLKWGIVIDKEFDDSWRFGIMLSHWCEETYFMINLFKRTIRIGKFYQEDASVCESPVVYVVEKMEDNL